ncbi:hypothetical protein OOK06_01885 [Streptomyces sp. NBC_00340]|uniref:DUF6602 domain-containing protein n=1 Tax=Streptomyces sp. NBC_00340 TaxID=2975716 RepID=UPI00224CAFB1|nr:DUF6602 domain-containing protein [Streptomyces sp. NBC_00340]MCX5130847.1 hypothetical protein [Streptomyces sp. NBC_00340]
MIRTIADLLSGILREELPKLDKVPVKHGPTIGDMYEGLSADLLNRALPDGLGLRVVSGFARDGRGQMSGQLDCMVVRGEGKRLPYTNAHVWHVRDIIAIIEVKKNLHSAELHDAFAQLKTVSAIEHPYYQGEAASSDAPDRNLAPSLRTFAEMSGKIVSDRKSLSALPHEEEAVFRAIALEQVSAIRVILGLHGFKSEQTFRSSLVDYIQTNLGNIGFGPTDFPQLIISGGYSLAKANGRPFMTPLVDGWWPFYFSTPENPLGLLLEFIWTRLDEMYGLGEELWGEDLEIEVGRVLLSVRAVRTDGGSGWEARSHEVDNKSLNAIPTTEQWRPEIIELEEFVLLLRLCEGEEVRSDDPEIKSWLDSRGVDFSDVLSRLLKTRLVASSGHNLKLIAKECRLAMLPTGEYVAGENSTGRFDRWMYRQIEAAHKHPPNDGSM